MCAWKFFKPLEPTKHTEHWIKWIPYSFSVNRIFKVFSFSFIFCFFVYALFLLLFLVLCTQNNAIYFIEIRLVLNYVRILLNVFVQSFFSVSLRCITTRTPINKFEYFLWIQFVVESGGWFLALRMVRNRSFWFVNSLFMQFVRFQVRKEGTQKTHTPIGDFWENLLVHKTIANKIWNSPENSHIF